MGTFGVNMNEFEGKLPGGFVPPEPGPQQFEIQAVTEGVIGKGEFAGERYLSVKCVQISGDEPGTRTTNVFLGMSTNEGKYGRPIEQTVGYLKAWGRYDIIENEDADVNELIGTTFEADVALKTGTDGNVKVFLNKIVAISHADVTPGMVEEPPPAPKPAPAPMRRGR